MSHMNRIIVATVGFSVCVAMAVADPAPPGPCYKLFWTSCSDCLSLEMVTDCNNCACVPREGGVNRAVCSCSDGESPEPENGTLLVHGDCPFPGGIDNCQDGWENEKDMDGNVVETECAKVYGCAPTCSGLTCRRRAALIDTWHCPHDVLVGNGC